MAEREPLVRCEALSYAYPDAGQPALRAIDLEVAEGEFCVLAGRSGCGKSTLLRALLRARAALPRG